MTRRPVMLSSCGAPDRPKSHARWPGLPLAMRSVAGDCAGNKFRSRCVGGASRRKLASKRSRDGRRGDEAVDCVVGGVLEGRVGQVGVDVGLVNDRPVYLAGRAGVEPAA